MELHSEDAEKLKKLQEEEQNKPFEERFLITKDGKYKKKSLHNAKAALLNNKTFKNLFQYNEFTDEVETNKNVPSLYIEKGKMKDFYAESVALQLENNGFSLFSMNLIDAAIRQVAHKKTYNPVKDWINRQKWDGKPRIETMFIDLFGADDTPFVRNTARLMMAGLVERPIKPGCKFDVCVVLHGGQGLGKTTFCEGMAASGYYSRGLSSYSISDKDTCQKLLDSHVVELEELAAMGKTSIEEVKSMIDTREMKFRQPYGRNTESYLCHHVFIGTTNSTTFLKDLTGSRRFYVIECKSRLNRELFTSDYIAQLYAEAFAYYLKAEKTDAGSELLNPDYYEGLNEARDTINDQFTDDNPYAEKIQFYTEVMPVPEDWYKFDNASKRNYFEHAYNNINDENLKEVMKKFLDRRDVNGNLFKWYADDTGESHGDCEAALAKMGKLQKTDLTEVVFHKDGYKQKGAVKQATEWLTANGWKKKQIKINNKNGRNFVKTE